MGISRNRYINEALEYYKRVQNRALLASTLERESNLVRVESMSILKDFQDLDYVD